MKSTYTLMHELLASPDKPMPADRRRHQLVRMHMGLAALEADPAPSYDDWRVCSDAVNLMETLVKDMQVCEDAHGLLDDAVKALAIAGARHLQTGAPLRLDGPGIVAVRSIHSDYAEMLSTLPERTMVRCHRLTERRIKEIHAGKKKPHDVEVIAL